VAAVNLGENSAPIEVWLTWPRVSINCLVVFSDETVRRLDVCCLSMGGAQREVTGLLISEGYEPAGSWKTEDDRGRETMRPFRRPAPHQGRPDGQTAQEGG
jgi:hypothetical protein